jgi:putative endonuclease
MPGYVYILTNRTHTVLYTGVTSNLEQRMEQHLSSREANSFTSRYRVKKLVYVEEFNTIIEAITREKQIKAGSRRKKLELIESINPDWQDLFSVT